MKAWTLLVFVLALTINVSAQSKPTHERYCILWVYASMPLDDSPEKIKINFGKDDVTAETKALIKEVQAKTNIVDAMNVMGKGGWTLTQTLISGITDYNAATVQYIFRREN